MKITEVLTKLDPADDMQWTEDGSPRVDVVQEMADDKTITRADITNAAPDLTRETAAERASGDQRDNADAEPPAEGEAETERQGEGEGQGEAKAQEVAKDIETKGAEPAKAPEEESPDLSEQNDAPEEMISTDTTRAEMTAEEEEEAAPPVQLTELEQTQAELSVKSEEMYEAQKLQDQAKEKADRLADEVNTLNRRITAIEKTDPNHNTAGVRAFIKQQNQNRVDRARRLQNFIGDSGVNPHDLAKELDVRSPIDRAMAGRKPPRGSQRPVLPSRN